jgi:hypothetical protein
MNIEIFYIQDCPGYGPTLEAINQIIADERIAAAVTPIEVKVAIVDGFLGSPTVRINGRDIEDVPLVSACGLACRSYTSDGKRRNAPSREMIRSAIRDARNSK